MDILTPAQVAPSALLDFYRLIYPDRIELLPRVWEWLNRPEFPENRAPLLLVDGNRVVGHAGRIPFLVSWEGREISAAWFIDFGILPEFRGKGWGKVLAKKWMESCEIFLAMGANEYSIGVFGKAGWVENSESYLHHFLVRPFHHPKIAPKVPSFLRAPFNRPASRLLQGRYRRYALSPEALQWSPIGGETLAGLETVFSRRARACEGIRDRHYLSWRLGSAPDREKYFLVGLEGNKIRAVVKKRDDKKLSGEEKVRQIEILWVPGTPDPEELARLIATLGLWCGANDFAYLRWYTTDGGLSRRIRQTLGSVVRRPRFAFFAANPALMQELQKASWHWELIDADFEFA